MRRSRLQHKAFVTTCSLITACCTLLTSPDAKFASPTPRSMLLQASLEHQLAQKGVEIVALQEQNTQLRAQVDALQLQLAGACKAKDVHGPQGGGQVL